MVQLEQDGQKPRQVRAKDAFVSPATCEYNKEIFVSFSAAVGLNKTAPDGWWHIMKSAFWLKPIGLFIGLIAYERMNVGRFAVH